ncbi:hypothetical protein EMIT043CA1_150120 [Pseudomonas brassicacearum]
MACRMKPCSSLIEVAPEIKEVSKSKAIIGRSFVRIGQISFAVGWLIPHEAHRYSAAIIFNLSMRRPLPAHAVEPDEIPHEKSPVAQWRQTIRSLRRSLQRHPPRHGAQRVGPWWF